MRLKALIFRPLPTPCPLNRLNLNDIDIESIRPNR